MPPIKPAFLLGALFASVFAAPAARAVPSVSVQELVNLCEAGFPPPGGNSASLARRQACTAYLDAVVGTVIQLAALAGDAGQQQPANLPPNTAARRAVFCISENEPMARLAEVFLAFAKANPRYADRVAASLAVSAFAAAYPCR